MGIQHIELEERTTADPATVFALLRDGSGWPGWSQIGSFELEREGEREREGVGAIRVFRTGRVTSRERIVEIVENRRFSYELVSGLAIRDYRADIDLEPDGQGTKIHWHSSFRSKVPGMGGIYRRTLARFIGDVVRGLVARSVAQKTA
jgi:carbon monoxide dehydrogenase subunit G